LESWPQIHTKSRFGTSTRPAGIVFGRLETSHSSPQYL
jgi:hypothetical protein